MKVTVLLLAVLALSACEREQRQFQVPVSQASRQEAERTRHEENAYSVSQGKQLFRWFNCVGCHAMGGGGMGVPLMDAKWRYGAEPKTIFQTIMDGRPGGMPAFGALIRGDDVRKLVAFVRSMAQLTPFDTRPARPANMSETNPQRRAPEERR